MIEPEVIKYTYTKMKDTILGRRRILYKHTRIIPSYIQVEHIGYFRDLGGIREYMKDKGQEAIKER